MQIDLIDELNQNFLIDLHKLKADPFNAVNANDTGADIASSDEQQ